MSEELAPFGPWRILTWPLHHVRWKIVVPYAFLTVVLAIAGSYLATSVVTGSLNERFDNQLAEAGRVVADSVVRQERDHLEIVRAASFTEGVNEAVLARNESDIEGLLLPIVTNGAVERLEILDSSGQRLDTFKLVDENTLTYEEIVDTDVPADWPIVQETLAGETDAIGDKHAQLIETEDGFFLYTAGAITDGVDINGVVLVGTSLKSLVGILKTEALADVTVYDFSGNPIDSTFARPTSADASEEAILNIQSDSLSLATAGEGAVRETRTLWGREYDVLYGRLIVRDHAVGLYSVGLPSDFIFSAASATRTQIALLFGISMAAVLGIGFFLAHQLTKPIMKLVKTARIVASGDLTARSGVTTSDEIGTLARSFDEMTEKLQRQHLGTIKALTSAIDARDPYTMGHSVRVGQLAIALGRKLGLDDRDLSQLEIGGYLHDVGKIGIRDAILLKPGSLTPEERQAIQEHPTIGLAILDSVDLPEIVTQFVASHHERLDGSGYPHQLKGVDLPMVARIAAVSDMYDAVTSDRPYRGPMSPHEALALLRSEAGRLLDRSVVEAMAELLDDWEDRRRTDPDLQGFKLPALETRKVTV
ncbi:MAG: HD domain-containing protein [Chloroflexi bacterium]|nr:HD domain-containing protein [Chloroflexota bacterium]